ncbi:MAG: Uma2 family endonuclease [Gemmataceae bacterium]
MKPARVTKPAPLPDVPPLYNGDRLAQPEFHRRYQAYPEDVKFELIGGIVFMASPLHRGHGTASPQFNGVLFLYQAATTGVELAENMTVILGEESEPQPDLLLRIDKECGGQSDYNEESCLVGAPELVAEVAHSSVAIDLHRKRRDYQRAGVQEYVVFSVREGELHWFHFPSKRQLKPDRQGVWRSRVFPGLWLHGPALAARDSATLIATVQQGLASPEHAAFVRDLEGRRKK